MNGSRARLDFAPILLGIALALSWVQFLFESSRRFPSGGCAWALMIWIVIAVLLLAQRYHKPPSSFFGLT
ncbi:MAG: hypothetical protein HUU17_06920 [Chthonomonadales bacterium]|nr:hypothetical protein [Chthonomonadales bacterium]